MSKNELRAVCSFQMEEVKQKHQLTVLQMQVLWLAATYKELTNEVVAEELVDVTPTYAQSLLQQLKTSEHLDFKGGKYVLSPSGRIIINELT